MEGTRARLPDRPAALARVSLRARRPPPATLECGVDLAHLPGGDLVAKGLEDLASTRETVEALLVSIAATRLRSGGLSVPGVIPDAEHRL